MSSVEHDSDRHLDLDRPLPEGWTLAGLGFIADSLTYGYTASATAGSHGPRFLRITDIQNGRVDWDTVPTCTIEETDIRKYGLVPGDIVFARTGATTGKSFLIRSCPLAVFASYLIRLRLLPGINPALLDHFFQTPDYWTFISDNVAGIAQPNCNATKLSELKIPIPPSREQQRLVEAIAVLLSKVGAARDHLSRVPAILKRFRQSVLAAACSGKLTEDWRTEHPAIESGHTLAERIQQSHVAKGLGHGGQAATPTEGVHNVTRDALPDTWAVEELMVLCQPGRAITYGILKPGPDVSGGIPYIRVADFPNNRLKLEGIRKTTKQIADMYRRSALREGDLLLSIRGTAGRVCRVPANLDGANITQDTARISVHQEVCPDYIQIYLCCPSIQERLDASMKGVAVRGVNIGDVRVLQVALPPRLEQEEIVRRVNTLFKISDSIEQGLMKAVARTNKLTQSIHAKAFRGELVPTEAELARREGREYEPASVLLERIRAERANHAKAASPPQRKLRKASAHI